MDTEEETIEGHIVQVAENLKLGQAAAIMVVNFEDENLADGENAIEYTRSLKLEYNATDVAFWFTQLDCLI